MLGSVHYFDPQLEQQPDPGQTIPFEIRREWASNHHLLMIRAGRQPYSWKVIGAYRDGYQATRQYLEMEQRRMLYDYHRRYRAEMPRITQQHQDGAVGVTPKQYSVNLVQDVTMGYGMARYDHLNRDRHRSMTKAGRAINRYNRGKKQ